MDATTENPTIPEDRYEGGEAPQVGDRVKSRLLGTWTVVEVGQRFGGAWLFAERDSGAGAVPYVCSLVSRGEH